MIWNIVDGRKREYRWKRVNAVIESTSHDNACEDADQAPETDLAQGVFYEEMAGVSVAEAVAWAVRQGHAVTLYLYDDGEGIAEG